MYWNLPIDDTRKCFCPISPNRFMNDQPSFSTELFWPWSLSILVRSSGYIIKNEKNTWWEISNFSPGTCSIYTSRHVYDIHWQAPRREKKRKRIHVQTMSSDQTQRRCQWTISDYHHHHRWVVGVMKHCIERFSSSSSSNTLLFRMFCLYILLFSRWISIDHLRQIYNNAWVRKNIDRP